MGMSAGTSGGAKSEINVTPLVDVCLVLLIIFMVLVPRNVPELSVRIPPESKRPQERKVAEDPLVVAMTPEGGLSLNGTPITQDRLSEALTRQLEFRETRAVFVDFEDGVPYGEAVPIIDLAKRSGADVVAILKEKGEVIPSTLRPGGP